MTGGVPQALEALHFSSLLLVPVSQTGEGQMIHLQVHRFFPIPTLLVSLSSEFLISVITALISIP